MADALLSGAVGRPTSTRPRRAEARDRGLRLTLSLAAAPRLLSVPWEFLYRRPRFLASQRRSPLVRVLETGASPAPPVIGDEVRILGIVASPRDLPPLRVDDERQRVERALAGVVASGRVHLDWLEPATARTLRQALRDGNYHVIHYVGHSDFTVDGQGVIFLEGDAGSAHAVDETLLANLLSDQDRLRLVVLNSCEGARTSIDDPYAGVATTLVHLGVPAVVAMQFEISDAAAIVFAEELYTNLIGRQDPIDASVAEARKAIYSEVDEVEWATPVLFVRDPDAELFRFTVEPAALPPPPPPEQPPRRRRTDAPTSWERAARVVWRDRRLRAAAIAAGLIVLGVLAFVTIRDLGDDDGDGTATATTTAAPATTTTTTAAALTPTFSWPTVQVGDEGLVVEVLQRLLGVQGHPVPVTGFFDDATEDATRAVEGASNIPVDGVVGRVTWQQLVVPLRRGDTGEAVLAAEQLLADDGADLEPDDRFSNETQTIVLELQREHGLATDGIVDLDTWEVLLGAAAAR